MPEPMTAIIGGSALLGVGGSIFGAAKQSEASDKATKAATAANDKALKLQKEIFETQRKDMQPWLVAGRRALTQLDTELKNGTYDLSGFGFEDLEKDPGYQFRLKQGQEALEATAAARGRLINGNQLAGLQSWGQEFASNEFGNAFARAASERDARYNRLANMAGIGLNTAGTIGQYASQYGQQAGQTIANTGQQIGQNYLNQGNIWAGLGGDLATIGNKAIGNYLTYKGLGA